MKQSIKLILIIFVLCLCGSYPVKADDDYTLQSVYSVEPFSGTSIMPQISMPEVYIYPSVSSPPVSNTLVLTNKTRYLLTEELRFEDSLHNTYLTPSVVEGAQDGYITSYTQRITYTNTESDMYEAHLNIVESKGGSGVVTIYAQKNKEWVQVAVDNFENTYSTGDLMPSSAITGWRFDVVYTLNNRFKLFTPKMYANGYKMNSIGFNIVSPADEQKEALNDIKENTNRTNGLLGTIKTAIDNIKNAIDDVITGITNLPNKIMNGLKTLFIPDDFSNTLQDGLEDISDSLGVVGYPIQFINDTLNTIKNTSGESLTVHLPSYSYKGHVIFPSYYRSNIFYFGNNLVFSNVNLVTPFTQFFSLLGVDCSTITISQLVKILMRFCTGLAIISAIVNYYNNIFGTNIDSGEEESDDN